MAKIQPAYAKYNLIQILKERLQKDISENLTSILFDETVSNYREKIKPNIEKYVENIVIENIKSNENIMEMRTDFQVFVRIQEDEKLKTVEKTERDSCEGCARDSDCRDMDCKNYSNYIENVGPIGSHGFIEEAAPISEEVYDSLEVTAHELVTAMEGGKTCKSCIYFAPDKDSLCELDYVECKDFLYWEAINTPCKAGKSCNTCGHDLISNIGRHHCGMCIDGQEIRESTCTDYSDWIPKK